MKHSTYMIITFLVCLLITFSFFLTGSAKDSYDDYISALITNASAYWEKGTMLQYDDPEPHFQSIYFAPEEVTEDQTMYSTCGTFISALFMETIGIETPWRTAHWEPYCKNNEDSPYIIDSIYHEEYNDLVASDELVSHLLSQINVGDLILLRFNLNNKKGHIVMIYDLIYDDNGNVKDAWLIHSTGSLTKEENYASVYDNEHAEGTVRISKMSKLLRGFYSKMNGDMTNVYYCALIRLLATPGEWLDKHGDMITYSITDSTKLRISPDSEYIIPERTSITECYVPPLNAMLYTGENVVPAFPVKTGEGGELLTEGKDYIIAYQHFDNIDPGQASVSLNGIGNYCGSKQIFFNILE